MCKPTKFGVDSSSLFPI